MAKTRLYAVIVPILTTALLLLGLSSVTGSNFDLPPDADAQTTATPNTPTNTFEIDGQIGSLILH